MSLGASAASLPPGPMRWPGRTTLEVRLHGQVAPLPAITMVITALAITMPQDEGTGASLAAEMEAQRHACVGCSNLVEASASACMARSPTGSAG